MTTLRELGAEVSLLVRTSKCNNCTRSPPTAVLRKSFDIFEYGGSDALAALLDASAFDLVLVGLWFWYDPQPSFAELLLPVLRAHADGGGGPLVALLSDDAHAPRARRLAHEEYDSSRERAYLTQATNLGLRQRALFSAVDGVFYLTAMDRDAEKELLPLNAPIHVGLLRMAVAPGGAPPLLGAAMRSSPT